MKPRGFARSRAPPLRFVCVFCVSFRRRRAPGATAPVRRGTPREFKSEDGLMTAALSHYRELVIVPMLSLRHLSFPFDEVLHQAIETLTLARNRPRGCLFTHMKLAKSFLGTSL